MLKAVSYTHLDVYKRQVQLAASHAEQITQEASCSRRPLRIAVPKGSLTEGAVKVLAAAGLDVEGLLDSGRTLMLRNGDEMCIRDRPMKRLKQ